MFRHIPPYLDEEYKLEALWIGNHPVGYSLFSKTRIDLKQSRWIYILVGSISLFSTTASISYLISSVVRSNLDEFIRVFSISSDNGMDERTFISLEKKSSLLPKAPSIDSWVPARETWISNRTEKGKNYARSYHYKGYVYEYPSSTSNVVGVVRPGKKILVTKRVRGYGCNPGYWYEVIPFGFICTERGFVLDSEPTTPKSSFPEPAEWKRLPYKYAEVVTKRAPRYKRIPTIEQEKQTHLAQLGIGNLPDVVSDLMDGIYFVAIVKLLKDTQRQYYRTVRGQYIRYEDAKVYPTYPMRGEKLNSAQRLPLAFIYGKDQEVYLRMNGSLKKIGMGEMHARFPVEKRISFGGKPYVQGSDGILLKRNDVRIVEETERPISIPKNQKWIHINLDEQTLVAYEGDYPVYATLVSSGKQGYDTPRGLFQIRHKYLTKTMNGEDPIDGFYEVEEVPWTMYYWKSYALHGAYWHNDFGKVRSHGCTNIPPADAHWLYYWTDPQVPDNWHAVRQSSGTWVYFTRDKLDGETN